MTSRLHVSSQGLAVPSFLGFARSQGHLSLPAGFGVSAPFCASLLLHMRSSLPQMPSIPLIYLVRAQFLSDEYVCDHISASVYLP